MAQEEKEWNAIDFSKQEWQWEDNLSVISLRNGFIFVFLTSDDKENKRIFNRICLFNVDERFALRPFAFRWI